MDRTERFYKIEALLQQRKAVSFAALQAELEVSRSTLKRDLEYLRTRMHAPIVWDREAGGYPNITRDDILAVFAYAQELLHDNGILPIAETAPGVTLTRRC